MSGPMSRPALDPSLKRWKSMSVPESVDETQPPEKIGDGEHGAYPEDNDIPC